MAELKTKPSDSSVTAFIDTLEHEQSRKDCLTLLPIMEKLSGEGAKMWGSSIVGFGEYHYKYASGREGDYFLTGFSPRKKSFTIYIMSGFDIHTELMKSLGKYTTGKSCLYVKKLDDIDMKVLEQIVIASLSYMKKTYP